MSSRVGGGGGGGGGLLGGAGGFGGGGGGGGGGRNWLTFGELRSFQGNERGDRSSLTEYKGWSPSLQEIHLH